jgi:hypothetical protein
VWVSRPDVNPILGHLRNRKLIQFCVGAGLRLDLDARPHYEVTIECPLWIGAANASPLIEPTDVTALAAVRGLLMKQVTDIEEIAGTLTIRFDEDAMLVVPPDPDYEAWQVRADDGLLVVCIPGGELAVSSPDDETPAP